MVPGERGNFLKSVMKEGGLVNSRKYLRKQGQLASMRNL